MSHGSSSSKKSQIPTWKTTCISQGSEGTNWTCWPWSPFPAPPRPHCPQAQDHPLQLRHGSSSYEKRTNHEMQLSEAIAGPQNAPYSSSELHLISVLIRARLQVLSVPDHALQLSSGLWADPTYITDLFCSPDLGTGQLYPTTFCRTVAFPELHLGPCF